MKKGGGLMRTIDADRLLEEKRIHTYYHLPNGDIAIPLIDIKNAPTIEPERKKGKWIEQDDSWDGVYYECSACGEPWTTIDGTPWDNGMNFCPHCGADMRKDGEADD